MLIDVETSKDITSFQYPAGEWQVRFNEDLSGIDNFTLLLQSPTPEMLVRTALLRNAISNLGGSKYVSLVMPYLPYGRADRVFTKGDCCGLETFGQLIGNMNFDDVITLDAHNAERAKFYIPRLINRSAMPFVWQAIKELKRGIITGKRLTILFPDLGARQRYSLPPYTAYNTDHLYLDIVHAKKVRDAVTWEFKGFNVPKVTPDQPLLIIDDICDDGGTFIGIANELEAQEFKGFKGLYTTHGIYSRGCIELFKHFNCLFTTDSLLTAATNVNVFSCIDYTITGKV